MSFLLTAGWIPCCIYGSVPAFWLVIHPYADFWRRRHRAGKPVYQFLIPLWVAMWVALYALTYPLKGIVFYRARWSWILTLIFFVVGSLVYARAGSSFSLAQLIGYPELKPDQHRPQLAVSGIRQRVRHPFYLAHICQMLGFSLGTGLAACWTLTVFAIITGAVMIHHEERELLTRFGDEYREYQQRVPAIIPRV